jgi:hypothetical protein
MNRRCLRSPHDVEGDGLMRVAAKAADFEITKTGIDRVAQRRRWLRRSVERQHALGPCLAGELVGLLARFRGRGCDGSGGTGKPLQIAVDSVPGTMGATRVATARRYWSCDPAPACLARPHRCTLPASPPPWSAHDEISSLVYEAIVSSRHRWKLARFPITSRLLMFT